MSSYNDQMIEEIGDALIKLVKQVARADFPSAALDEAVRVLDKWWPRWREDE